MDESRIKALEILDKYKIPLRGDRLEKLAMLLVELGHDQVKLDLVQRGSLMRKHKATTRKIGQMRKGKSSVEIWAVWES